ncbi:MAG: hypothetical protein IKM61_02450, partial [Eubacteriaceae bacterium]|nr:hypothetical protein [Eubacteriaceae bacterium]
QEAKPLGRESAAFAWRRRAARDGQGRPAPEGEAFGYRCRGIGCGAGGVGGRDAPKAQNARKGTTDQE